MSYRTGRLAETIKKEVSIIVREKVKDPQVGFVTITDVEVTSDSRYAKIYFSVLGSAEQRKETVKALNRASGFIRNELGHLLTLRYTPELTFKLDESLDHGIKIQEILQKVNQQEQSDEQLNNQ